MTDILSSMTAWLLTRTEVTSVITARIYPMTIPPGTTSNPTQMPCMTYQLIDEPVVTTHDGRSTYTARIQIDAFGGSFKSARGLAEAVHGVMHGFRGAWGDVEIGGVFRKRKQDMIDPEASLFRVSQDFIVNYHE